MKEIKVDLVETAEGQTVLLPVEFRIHAASVWVRRDGDLVILEPVKPNSWPEGFWEKIRIDDPTFKRHDQGEMPPAPVLG